MSVVCCTSVLVGGGTQKSRSAFAKLQKSCANKRWSILKLHKTNVIDRSLLLAASKYSIFVQYGIIIALPLSAGYASRCRIVSAFLPSLPGLFLS
jgi:hypothetical protein